ncbi:alpha/beta hydrolase [Hamadaea sp. NPDC050747]|uniref:alpha/beta fold hydrolase n=1 Tax=Hamadaea sp. NPDC050747 TaxID=3155789 RepID=UPI0033E8CCBF
MEFFTVNGVRLAVEVSGAPGARPLLLLHSGGSTRSSWDSVAPAFAGSHRVYAVDLRGYGDSDRPGAYSFELMRDDVLGLLDVLGADAVDVIGHSLGGTVSWLVAQERPGRVRRLVIEDSPPPRAGDLRGGPLGPPPEEELPFAWEALVAVMGQLADPDPAWWDRLGLVSARVLLLAGGAASHVPQELFAVAAGRLADARVVEIPVGHHIHREALAEFLAVVVPFLTGPE